MTDQHFVVVKKLLTEKPQDFFVFVKVGVDRIHHGMQGDTDSMRQGEQGNRWQCLIRDYKKLDGYIDEVLSLVPRGTVVLVISDHGAKTVHGGIALNEWLIRNDLLALKDEPLKTIAPFRESVMDWGKTCTESGWNCCRGPSFVEVRQK